ncbi:MAG TPA: AMP-binding protein [bacterium]|nr:AMP-binding protein [bacterium]
MKKARLLWQDFRFLWKIVWVRLKCEAAQRFKKDSWSIIDLFEKTARRSPDRPALEYAGKTWTYGELDRIANRVAHWALANGVRSGDVVVLTAVSRPAVIWSVIGLAKIGATVSILRPGHHRSLSASYLEAHKVRILLAAKELAGEIPAPALVHAALHPFMEEEKDLEAYSDRDPNEGRKRETRWHDVFLHLCTSGTLGDPKPVKVTHSHLYAYLLAQVLMKDLQSSDVIYCCLPLSHGMGLASCVMSSWVVGAKVYLAAEFAPEKCFEECAKSGATVLTYVGLVPQILLGAPPGAFDRAHSLRVALGHEMKGYVWEKMRERFGIPQIVEFYGATDGPALLVNIPGGPGAAGYLGPLTSRLYPVALIRLDSAGNPVRDEKGRCLRCREGEAGELLTPFKDGDPTFEFSEYADPALDDPSLKAKRVARDVFRKGDRWTRTGDLFRRDGDGFFYYLGRAADNVGRDSGRVLAEIEEAVLTPEGYDFLKYASVYPVETGDGKVLMATVVAGRDFRIDRLYDHFSEKLESDSLPLVVRVKNDFGELTATFRMSKPQLAREGFDPKVVSDALYVWDETLRNYVRLDASRYRSLSSRPTGSPAKAVFHAVKDPVPELSVNP